MLKRTIQVSSPYKLSIAYGQLILSNTEEKKQIPVEDLGFVVLDHPHINITQAVAQELSENNVAVIFCSKNHHPNSMLLNLDGHHLQNEIFRAQLSASEPLKKNLWKQTIEAKIKNQSALLRKLNIVIPRIDELSKTVLSGDTGNNEAQAARLYWPALFGKNFLRERFGLAPNNMLNYGYAILRASVARAIVGSGLLPTLGMHHHNRYNAYCLADDIMEPYRPYVDSLVFNIYESIGAEEDLSVDTRIHLLEFLQHDVFFNKTTRPLMLGISQTTASLARCFEGEQKRLQYP